MRPVDQAARDRFAGEWKARFAIAACVDVPLTPLGPRLGGGRDGLKAPEPNEYSKAGYTWPLACTPVPEVVLRAKQAATFPEEES